MNQGLKNAIISALSQSINLSEANGFPTSIIATKALLNAIALAAGNFEVPGERDFIMGKIFEALQIPTVEVREAAM